MSPIRPSLALVSSFVLALMLATGCASVTRGTNDILEVTSDPVGARVVIHRLDRGFTDRELDRNLQAYKLKGVKNANQGRGAIDRFRGPIEASTPISFSLARKGRFLVEISKEGYESKTITVRNRVAGKGAAGMAGNVVVGGIVGAGVDAGTGATLNLTPNPINVTLVPLFTQPVPTPNE